MRAIPLATREGILGALDQGQRQADVACAYRVSVSSVERLARMRREERSLVPRKQGRRPIVPDERHASFRRFFEMSVVYRVTPSYKELARRYYEHTGVRLNPNTLLRLCTRLKLHKPLELPGSVVAARYEKYFEFGQ